MLQEQPKSEIADLTARPSEELQAALPNGPRDAAGALSLKDRSRLVKCLRELGYLQAADEIMALQGMLDKLIPVMSAAVDVICAPGWEIESDEDEELERVLRAQGFCVAAPDAARREAVSGAVPTDKKEVRPSSSESSEAA